MRRCLGKLSRIGRYKKCTMWRVVLDERRKERKNAKEEKVGSRSVLTCGRGDARNGEDKMSGEVKWRLPVEALGGKGQGIVISEEGDDLPGKDIFGGERLRRTGLPF